MSMRGPEIFVSPGFLDAANTSNVLAIQGNATGINAVLRRANEQYALGKLSTALGAISLVSAQENVGDAGLAVYRVVPSEPARAKLTIAGTSSRVDEVASQAETLTVPNADPNEVALAWAVYEAARARGSNSTEQMLTTAAQLACGFLQRAGRDFLGSTLGRAVGRAGEALPGLAAAVPDAKRAADKPVIESAKPIQLTFQGWQSVTGRTDRPQSK